MILNEVVEIEIAVFSPLFVPTKRKGERKKGDDIISSYRAINFFCSRKKDEP